MTYKFVIHPVDLQDHDGFLSFLSHYAGQGYQAVQIHRVIHPLSQDGHPAGTVQHGVLPPDRPPCRRGCSPFQGSTTESSSFHRAGSPEARETWNQTVVADYAAFVPYNLISLLSKIIRFLVLPVVVLSVFLSFVKPILQDNRLPSHPTGCPLPPSPLSGCLGLCHRPVRLRHQHRPPDRTQAGHSLRPPVRHVSVPAAPCSPEKRSDDVPVPPLASDLGAPVGFPFRIILLPI